MMFKTRRKALPPLSERIKARADELLEGHKRIAEQYISDDDIALYERLGCWEKERESAKNFRDSAKWEPFYQQLAEAQIKHEKIYRRINRSLESRCDKQLVTRLFTRIFNYAHYYSESQLTQILIALEQWPQHKYPEEYRVMFHDLMWQYPSYQEVMSRDELQAGLREDLAIKRDIVETVKWLKIADHERSLREAADRRAEEEAALRREEAAQREAADRRAEQEAAQRKAADRRAEQEAALRREEAAQRKAAEAKIVKLEALLAASQKRPADADDAFDQRPDKRAKSVADVTEEDHDESQLSAGPR